MWYDFSDAATVTLNGSTVSQIDDKSGAGRHQSQGTAANQPAYTSGGQNGLNCATFDSTDYLQNATATPTTTQPYLVFVVAKRASGANNNMCGGGTYIFGTTVWNTYAGTTLASATAVDTLAHVFCAKSAGASSYLRLDGAQIASGNAGTTTFGSSTISSFSNSWIGTICEMLVCPEPTDTLRDNYIAALQTKWGTV